MNKKWGVKHFILIEQALQSDENVLMCFIGLPNYVSTTKHDKDSVLIWPLLDANYQG